MREESPSTFAKSVGPMTEPLPTNRAATRIKDDDLPKSTIMYPTHEHRPNSALSPAFFIVWTSYFCDYVLMTMQVPLFPLLQQGIFTTGCLFSGKALFQVLSSPLVNQVIDKVSDKKLLISFGLVVEVAACAIFAATFEMEMAGVPDNHAPSDSVTAETNNAELQTHFPAFTFLARAISGFGSAFISAGCQSLLQQTYSHNLPLRAEVMGLATTGIVGGVCVGPLFGGALFEINERLPYLALGSVELAVVVVVATWMAFERSMKRQGLNEPLLVKDSRREAQQDERDKRVVTVEESPESQTSSGQQDKKDKNTSEKEISVLSLLSSPEIVIALLAAMLANTCISSLEAAALLYISKTFELSPSGCGEFYLLASVPGVMMGIVGPKVGNYLYSRSQNSENSENTSSQKFQNSDTGVKRLKTPARSLTARLLFHFPSSISVWEFILILGGIVEGCGFMLGPKSSLAVNGVSLLLTGAGMGLVDCGVPPLLGEVADAKFGGTGKVFVLFGVAIQVGFILGPILGNAIFQAFDFVTASRVVGGTQVLFSLAVGARWGRKMLVN